MEVTMPTRARYPENAWRQREDFRKVSDAILVDVAVRCTCGERRSKGNLVVRHPVPHKVDRDLLMVPHNMVVLCRARHVRVHHHVSREVAA